MTWLKFNTPGLEIASIHLILFGLGWGFKCISCCPNNSILTVFKLYIYKTFMHSLSPVQCRNTQWVNTWVLHRSIGNTWTIFYSQKLKRFQPSRYSSGWNWHIFTQMAPFTSAMLPRTNRPPLLPRTMTMNQGTHKSTLGWWLAPMGRTHPHARQCCVW